MNFECLDFNEFYAKYYDYSIYDFKIKVDDNNSFEGFKYFSPMIFNQIGGDDKLLICTDNSNNILGVICFGTYGYENEKYEALSFIDVNINFRNQGIATKLANKLNKYLNPIYDKFYLSKLTDNGKLCHMDEVFKNCINKEVVIEN